MSPPLPVLSRGALVLYRDLPARVVSGGDRIEIEMPGGEIRRIRPKDVRPLHPGPADALPEASPVAGEVREAWEILSGTVFPLSELCELAYGEFTPSSAWAAWQCVREDLLFHGPPDAVRARTAEEVEAIRAGREAKAERERERTALQERIGAGTPRPGDAERLQGVIELAMGRSERCGMMKELGWDETPEAAHALLLAARIWTESVDPHPEREGVRRESSGAALGAFLEDEERRDLTDLESYAIDDEGNRDPDDAIALDGGDLWVHVADAACLVPPGSPADDEARARGASLYLPEGTAAMLPEGAVPLLGLGLEEISPALSFRFVSGDSPEARLAEVTPSLVRVSRLTYAQAEERLHEAPFSGILARTEAFHEVRRGRGAASIRLPEVQVFLDGDEVVIRPVAPLRSRDMVTDAMLMAGEAVARFASDREIPFPYATQPPPDETMAPGTPSEMFAYRKRFPRTRFTTSPDLHAGLGLPLYSQVTSPLRRYLDLVAHQQLRAHVSGGPLRDPDALLECVGSVEAVVGAIRRAERHANLHWKLVHLSRHPEWEGEGILVDIRGRSGVILVPDLGLEFRSHLHFKADLDSLVRLSHPSIDLPTLDVRFRMAAE